MRHNPTSAAFADLDQRRRPRPVRLPLHDVGPRAPAPLHERARGLLLLRSQQGRRGSRTTSSATTAAGSSTSPRAPGASETSDGGRGLGVVAADLDDDGRIDLFVANDGTANYFFRNLGGFRLRGSGTAGGRGGQCEGGYQAGMGVACGDLDGDGRPDLMVTNFYGEGTTLYQNLGGGPVRRPQRRVGHRPGAPLSCSASASRWLTSPTTGWLDVMITNGHVNDNRPVLSVRDAEPAATGNRPDGRLVDVSAHAGPAWDVLPLGRGLAAGDLDNDGRIDALILAQNDPVAYFHNQTSGVGHYLIMKLEGTKSNRDAVGAHG